MTNRDLDARIAATATVDSYLEAAKRTIAVCALPRPDDTRRVLALQEAVGDLSACLSRGHTDVEDEWALIAAIALSALEAGLVEEARRPVDGNGRP